MLVGFRLSDVLTGVYELIALRVIPDQKYLCPDSKLLTLVFKEG